MGKPADRQSPPIIPSWVVCVLTATGALVVLGFVSIGFYASFGGVMIASVVAIAAGTITAGIVDPTRAGRNIAVVVFYLLVLAAAYFLIPPALVGPVAPGARGGPGVGPARK